MARMTQFGIFVLILLVAMPPESISSYHSRTRPIGGMGHRRSEWHRIPNSLNYYDYDDEPDDECPGLSSHYENDQNFETWVAEAGEQFEHCWEKVTHARVPCLKTCLRTVYDTFFYGVLKQRVLECINRRIDGMPDPIDNPEEAMKTLGGDIRHCLCFT